MVRFRQKSVLPDDFGAFDRVLGAAKRQNEELEAAPKSHAGLPGELRLQVLLIARSLVWFWYILQHCKVLVE